jgi:hypothetical protein
MATVQPLTLLDLVQTLNEFAQTDDEVVAAVTHLVNSGQVRLGGNFTGARINLSTPAPPGAVVCLTRFENRRRLRR